MKTLRCITCAEKSVPSWLIGQSRMYWSSSFRCCPSPCLQSLLSPSPPPPQPPTLCFGLGQRDAQVNHEPFLNHAQHCSLMFSTNSLRMQGVAVRDLKLENILLDRAKSPRPLLKICDFGYSKVTAPLPLPSYHHVVTLSDVTVFGSSLKQYAATVLHAYDWILPGCSMMPIPQQRPRLERLYTWHLRSSWLTSVTMQR